ncbi:MAG: polysaccharide biosynthesis tyrosine autokinase [Sphingomonadales bacterium]|nr:polysaccharide biosynthesis tyrosine autokinase [Sphingomonadaceae bacterium]MBS3932187.1 polysaccharide biosynthesis tyrosine autokinase [Sphingomonadales bacterium]
MPSPAPAADPHFHGHGTFDATDEAEHFGSSRSAFDFRYIAAAIRANLWLIGAIIAAALAFALVATMLQTKRYAASSTIQINDSSGRILGGQDEPSSDQENTSYDVDRFLKTQTDIIQSRGLALRVAQDLKLIGSPQFYEAQGLPAPTAGTAPDALREQAVNLLVGNLAVRLPRDSRIVTVSYVSNNPELSARIANAYAEEFIQANLDRRFDSSSYARGYLEGQLTEAKAKLEGSERALNTYARNAGIIRTGEGQVESQGGKSTVDRGSSVTGSSLAQINTATNEATARRIEAEGRWRAVSSGPLLSSPLVLQNSTVVTLLTDRARVEAELSQDRARHLEDYPSVRAKVAQLAAINQQLNSVAINVRNSVRSDYQAALGTERALQGQVTRLKNETMSEQDRAVQYNLLAREADTNRQLYEGLLERYKTLNAVAGVSLSNVSVIDKAEVPKAPSSPNLFKNLLVGLIMGVGLAALMVFFKDQFDDAIRVPEDIEAKLQLALLGVVPQSQGGDPQEALLDPKSPISEAYNSLRGSLLYSTAEGLPQIMLITSAQASEGKTTSSHAIASGFARMGKKVLLIDGDMRRPSLHKRMDLPNERGLSTLLTSHDPLASAVAKSSQDYLSLLVAGPIPPSPTELLSTVRIEEILQEAAGQFDVVMVDSPPILGLADSPLMAALVDGVIFVVEADRSRRGSLKAALRRLRAMRPILLGAVLTKFDPLKAGNRYSEYYGYDYYQYESKDKD